MNSIKLIKDGSDKISTKRRRAVTIELKAWVLRNPYSLKEKYRILLTISKDKIKVRMRKMCGVFAIRPSGKYGIKRINRARAHPATGHGRPIKNFLLVIAVVILNRAKRNAVQAINKKAIQMPSFPKCSRPTFHIKKAGVTPKATRSAKESS